MRCYASTFLWHALETPCSKLSFIGLIFSMKLLSMEYSLDPLRSLFIILNGLIDYLCFFLGRNTVKRTEQPSGRTGGTYGIYPGKHHREPRHYNGHGGNVSATRLKLIYTYRISSNKRRTFGYPHWNKRLLSNERRTSVIIIIITFISQ